MTDDIRALTTRLAEEPGSLAFLELGETLRRRGQLDAALKVVQGGVSRYPGLADAHDLLARILCDRGELPGAFEAWADALRVDPLHAPALKGLAFLYFRAGDAATAHDYLARALQADPDDRAIPAALARIVGDAAPAPLPPPRAAAPAPAAPAERPGPDAHSSPNHQEREREQDGRHGTDMLLVDSSGMRLRGALIDAADHDVSDAVAAQLAGVSKEATRTARLLELGGWESIAVEMLDGHMVLLAPTPETVLLAAAGVDTPMAQLGRLAERAARDARGWLEREP